MGKSREILKKIRKERNWTQEQAATYLNIKRSTYACIEGGHRNPNLTTAKKISELFNIDMKNLVD